MFREKTVFILGAGASWHYSCPTGEELVQLVSHKAGEFRKFLLDSARIAHVPQIIADRFPKLHSLSDPYNVGTWQQISFECMEISDRLARSNPPVIDYFLAHNPDLRDIGRFLIAWVILECEAKHGHGRKNRNRVPGHEQNHRDDWYRYLLSKLMNDCRAPSDLCANQVTFVSFNYDVSLELGLYDGLTATSFFNNEPHNIQNFFSAERFLHVYGSVRDCPPIKLEGVEVLLKGDDVLRGQDSQWSNQQKLLDTIYSASKRISTIETHDKTTNEATIKAAAQIIDDARYVYILGYGFDSMNNQRLGLEQSLHYKQPDGEIRSRQRRKSIMLTNFLDRNQVNKRASSLFFKTTGHLQPNQSAIYDKDRFYVEKSTRDVYGALELDFDL